MGRPTGRFRRSERLLLSRDFQRVARDGVRVTSREFVLLEAPARGTPGRQPGVGRRFGITASRKVGPAVVRNRVKRQIREWIRRSREGFGVDVDVVVIARPGAADLGGRALEAELMALRAQLPRARVVHG